MKNTTLKEKLKRNELSIGSWITIGHPSVAEIMSNIKFDWLTIDMEHNAINLSDMQNLISVIQSKNIAALVRVAKNEEVAIKHAMDAGADGVIVPMINSKADAQKAVEFVKYPPEGKRGVGLSRAQGYGTSFESYKTWLSEHSVIIAQIEHIDGIRNAEEIISTKGIDAVIVGPYDLSGSMGYPGDFNRNDVKQAILKLEDICKRQNFPLGYHVVPPEINLVKERINNGYSFIAISTDFLFLSSQANKIISQL